MSINKKILEELEKIESNKNKKEAIKEALNFEYKNNDQFNARFKKTYREIVNEYYQ